MWPFSKRVPAQSWEDFIAEQPETACGDKNAHYLQIFNSGPCFLCANIRERRKKEADEDRLAQKIADAIFDKLDLAAHLSSPAPEIFNQLNQHNMTRIDILNNKVQNSDPSR